MNVDSLDVMLLYQLETSGFSPLVLYAINQLC